MCGIFGGIKNVKPEILKILGICNEERGTDGTGIFDTDGYIKSVDSFRNFLLSDETESIKNFKGYLVGHTRFATCGDRTEKNSHPFEFGKILGVHNGMLRNFDTLKTKYKVEHLECDSEILFYLLDKKGIEGLKEVVGYYTIIWADSTKPNKLYFIQHECSLAYIRGKDYLYFCTDGNDLEIALGNKIKTIELLEDTLYEIDINTLKIKQTKIKGLQEDIKGIVTYKSSEDYSQWEKNSYAYQDCATYDTGGYPKEDKCLDEDFWKEPNVKHGKGEKKVITESEHENYTILCSYCNEGIYVSEALKGSCPTCRTELSGVVYQCYHCENPILLEQVRFDDKCPICNLRMTLDNKHLLTV